MGFFDLLSPVFGTIDGWIEALPATLRLLLWAALASALTMKLYQWTSRQERMAALKAEARSAQRELASFDGELDEMMPLIKRSIGASLRMLGLAIGPAVLASIPVVFVLAWAATRFAYDLPPIDADVAIEIDTIGAPRLSWEPASAASAVDEGVARLSWPAEDTPARLLADGSPVLTLPISAPSPVVHQRVWWNSLFANPAGYLPADLPVQAVHLAIPAQEHLPFGPGWLRSWLTVMLAGIFAFSLLFKALWKIH